MFFDKKKKDENIEEIKKVVETKPSVEEIKEVKEEKQSAPLFIKLDKYENLLKEVQEVRALQNKLKEVISSLHQVNEAMLASIKAIESLAEAIANKIDKIDKTLVKPSLPYQSHQPVAYEVEELEEKIASLKKELDELQKIF